MIKNSPRLSFFVFLVFGSLLITSCAPLSKTRPAEGATSAQITENATANNQSLLEFTGSFVELSEEAQRDQLLQINKLLALQKADHRNKMKLATIYALPSSRLHDSAKAQTLLDELLKEKPLDGEIKALATLLRDHLRSVQKTRDEQKRADSTQQKLDASQQKIVDLERKLQELKSIEKAMVDRNTGSRK